MKLKDFKFRVVAKKKALCGDDECPCKSHFIYGDEAKARLSEFDGETQIELFTGFKDKNGTEIYEGDIIKCWDDNHYKQRDEHYSSSFAIPKEKEEKGYSFFEIRFLKECGFICGAIGMPPLDYVLGCNDCVEVVGNIHESPELLLWVQMQ